MATHSKITPSSTLQHLLYESIFCPERTAARSVTKVTNGLPRKRGAGRTRVKTVQCQSAQSKSQLSLRVKRSVVPATCGVMSERDAHLLQHVSIKREIIPGPGLPPDTICMLSASLLIDCGPKWVVEKHDIAVSPSFPSDCILLPSRQVEARRAVALTNCIHVPSSSVIAQICGAMLSAVIIDDVLGIHSDFMLRSLQDTMLRLLRLQSSESLRSYIFFGGAKARQALVSGSVVNAYLSSDCNVQIEDVDMFSITEHFGDFDESLVGSLDDGSIVTKIPLIDIAPRMTMVNILQACTRHGLTRNRNENISSLLQRIKGHASLQLECCQHQVTLVKRIDVVQKPTVPRGPVGSPPPNIAELSENTSFPPDISTDEDKEKVISGFCEEFSADNVLESGCMVCGQLTLRRNLTAVDDDSFDWSLLCDETATVTKRERRCDGDCGDSLPGPVVDNTCGREVCHICLRDLTAKKPRRPRFALANGLWLGDVPRELSDLTFAERLLVSRVRLNYCVVKVTQSMHYKMRANAIMFPSPVAKIYDILPPKREELDEVLAYLFIGPHKPTQQDHERAPMLVRRNKVWDALTWLKLNHSGYKDLELSRENLSTYSESEPPVVVNYRLWSGDREAESSGVYTEPENEGTESGPCPFAVHTVEAADISIDTDDQELKQWALMHLTKRAENTALGVGRGNQPESLYKNPALYPNAFPWLFPYGVGGLEISVNGKQISDTLRKRHLLMYHDKRFQLDPYFHLVAFNHEQIKSGAKGGFLTAKKSQFPEIAKRMINLDAAVLAALYARMEQGEHVVPRTEEEKRCFQVIHDLDHVGQHVPNSKTSKKAMKNELWSTICSKGAPSWFITFAPSDTHHPLALYMAGSSQAIFPQVYDVKVMERMIARNPVACARFFHFMVKAFIKHIIGHDSESPGLFGPCEGYYGTVEEQGRLRLHLHLVLWIQGALTPQEIRDRLENRDSAFQKELISYLESCHDGAYQASDPTSISEAAKAPRTDGFKDATYALPEAPPARCGDKCGECQTCQEHNMWQSEMTGEVDELLWRVNRHDSCHAGCTSKKYPKCKSRFPRKLVSETNVDTDTGHLEMRHGEPTLNTFNPVMTYLMRCNSDVTSLLSGTALKAVIAYVTDYITKNPLRTHTMFEVIRAVLRRNDEYLNGDASQEDKAHKLMVQITNSLTVKQEIGAPMASAYLLGHPDHYTNFTYKPFYWRPYVWEAKSCWRDAEEASSASDESRVIITRMKDGSLNSYSTVQDYTLRPKKFESLTLYEWIERYKKDKIAPTKSDKTGEDPIKPPREEVAGSRGREGQSNDSESDDSDFSDSDSEYAPETEEEDEENPRRSSSQRHAKSNEKFMQGHPQRNSHAVTLLSKEKCRIPLFLGGLLPREDQGNLEEYHIAMLTLYKPWRTGKDLKSEESTWKEAHDEYPFPDRFVVIRKMCNIRYECLDARDDYRQSRKKDEGAPFFMHGQFAKEADRTSYEDGALNGQEAPDFFLEAFLEATDSARKVDEMKKKMEAALMSSDWERVAQEPRISPSRTPLDGSLSTKKEWAHILDVAKEKEINERNVRMQEIDVEAPERPEMYMEVDAIDGVEVMEKSYFSKYCAEATLEDRERIDRMVAKYTLNEEQERAFRLVANHSLLKVKEPLAMHLGGMGGTGKSRVIDSLIDFFKSMGRGHIFLIIAPTGTAASLIGGQTYHSVLAFNNAGDSEEGKSGRMNTGVKALKNVRERLKLVEYVFMDETSMVNCEGLCNISQQMCNAMGQLTVPFAGRSMIWAGDFAQLPPIDGRCLFDIDVSSVVHTTNAVKSQKSNIGRALWHQVTDVVILKQNMRQKNQSEEDAQYRKVLENLRYNACTSTDVEVLKKRVASRFNHSVDMSEERFRHASMITGRNHCRDKVNEIGCRAFAKDTGQKLETFYSVDTLRSVSVATDKKGKDRKVTKKVSGDAGRPNDMLQDLMWSVDPAHTKHCAGALRLCVDMPVLIKNNVATELCITNGAEGRVAGWKTKDIGGGRRSLEILFVELTNPKKKISLEGLPQNVVPIAPQKQSIWVKLANGQSVPIVREQVPILPNFAMTDYCSQGRTRAANVVDLQHCKSYHSVYTALSRSSSYDGTVIIRMPDMKYLNGTLRRGLRQEFRELELLNEICRLRCQGTLRDSVKGRTREQLIKSYQKAYRKPAAPPGVHPSLYWNAGDELTPTEDNAKWKYVATAPRDEEIKSEVGQKENQPDPAKDADAPIVPQGVSDAKGRKRKADDPHHLSTPPKKPKNGPKKDMEVTGPKTRRGTGLRGTSNEFHGPKWERFSCAFDSVLSIVYGLFKNMPAVNTDQLLRLNPLWRQLIDNEAEARRTCEFKFLDSGRDTFRETLIRDSPDVFNYQANEVGEVCARLFDISFELPNISFKCSQCGITRERPGPRSAQVTITPDDHCSNLSDSFKYIINSRYERACLSCAGTCSVDGAVFPNEIPVLCVQTNGAQRNVTATMTLFGKKYALRGIVYGGGAHFTSRIISKSSAVHTYDGAKERAAVYEGKFSDLKNALWTLNGRIALLYIFTLKSNG